MAAVAHNPAFAKKVGIPTSVGRDFNQADKGKKFREGGSMDKYARMKQQAQEEQRDAKLRGFTDKAYEGSLTNTEMQPLPYRPKGGVDGMFKGGDGDMPEARTLPNRITPGKKSKLDEIPVKYARGGGIESRGKTKGKIVKMATGGFVRSADGIAQRGKTKATQIKMKRGGMC